MKLLSWILSIIICIASFSIYSYSFQESLTGLTTWNTFNLTSTAQQLQLSSTLSQILDTIPFPASARGAISRLLPTRPAAHNSHRMSTATAFNSGGSTQQQQQQHRPIRKVFYAREQAEGDGARVRRSIGTPSLRNLSPFLMFDHFNSNSPNGFPDHPHRGQETITYLMQGGMDHEDFTGNRGTLNTGDLQFMTAGRGIVHAEMPHVHADGSRNIGFQLWVDLPTHLKDCEPRYRDLRAKEIPVATVDDGKVTIKVISGQSHGIDSVKDLAYTPVWIFDFKIMPGGKVTQQLPVGWNAFAYVLEGTVAAGGGDQGDGLEAERVTPQKVDQYNICVFDAQGDQVHFEVDSNAKEPAHLVLIAGIPLDQPIMQYGPFVVSTKEDVYKAMFDYQTHTNGFERAKDWRSEIGNRAKAH